MEIKINGNPGIYYLVDVILRSAEGTIMLNHVDVDPVYTNAKRALLTAAIGYCYYALPKEEQSLDTVYKLLVEEDCLVYPSSFSDKFDIYMPSKKNDDIRCICDCFEEYSTLNVQTRQGVVTATVCALASFLGPNI